METARTAVGTRPTQTALMYVQSYTAMGELAFKMERAERLTGG